VDVRGGIHLPLRNNPSRYPQQSRILSCEFMVKLGTMTLTVEGAFGRFAPAMRVSLLLTLRLPNGSPRKIE